MKPKIEHPKVFVSYAWGTKDHQDKVLAFATELQNCGIDVLLDKWDLKEGHDSYAYMEKCVTDESVTNVLILLDPLYAQKADKRSGGVGTETQIISPEVYNKTKQERILPVVFERDKNNGICKPCYLKSTLHFDLSIAENYNSEFQRLVKRLFGIEVFPKPQLGNMPSWVTESTTTVSAVRLTSYGELRQLGEKERRTRLIDYLNEIGSSLNRFSSDSDDALVIYEELKTIRNNYLQLLRAAMCVDNVQEYFGDFFQEVKDEFNRHQDNFIGFRQTLLHELLIYTIALFYHYKDFEALSYFMNRAFIVNNSARQKQIGYAVFYHYCEPIHYAKNTLDNKNYHCGISQLWMDTIDLNICSKQEFVIADLLLYNCTLYGSNQYNHHWFPLTYEYLDIYNSGIKQIAQRMISKQYAEKWAKVFGYNDIESMKKAMQSVCEAERSGRTRRLRFNEAFYDAEAFTDYISVEEIGTMN